MSVKNEIEPVTSRAVRDPLALLRDVTADVDRWFTEGRWPFRFLPVRIGNGRESAWLPELDVFEKDGRLVTKIDLPGLKKEDVSVEVSDGLLTIAGERQTEIKEEKENVYRSERSFGRFVRTVPLPEGVTPAQVTATFVNGVLEVSVPLPAKTKPATHTVEITDGAKPKVA